MATAQWQTDQVCVNIIGERNITSKPFLLLDLFSSIIYINYINVRWILRLHNDS